MALKAEKSDKNACTSVIMAGNHSFFLNVIAFCMFATAILSNWACSFDPAGIPTVSQNNTTNTNQNTNNNENANTNENANENTNNNSICGNGIKEQGEQCDGLDLGGADCESLNLGEGELDCSPTCAFDTSGCAISTECGNNVKEGGEVCDGEDLGGQSCSTQEFVGGDLRCREDCTGFDFSGCYNEYCGDGEINGNEECDGTNLGGLNTCADHGCRRQSEVTCNSNCTFDLSACQSGHDEDGDGIDDNCDNCPTYANPGQSDNNNDGIGDVCEAPGNQNMLTTISVFDPMLHNEPSWTVWGGSWNYGGDVVSGDSNGQDDGNYLHSHSLPGTLYAVEATFHFDSGSPAGNSWAGIIFGHRGSYPNYHIYFCAYNRDAKNLSIWAIFNGTEWVSLINSPISSSATNSQWRKLHAFYNGTNLSCFYRDEAGANASVQISGNTQVSDNMSGLAGLRVYNNQAVFRSFVLYQ